MSELYNEYTGFSTWKIKTRQRQPIYWNRRARKEDCGRNQVGELTQWGKTCPHLQLGPSPSHMSCGMCAHICLNDPNSGFFKRKLKRDKKKSTKTKTSSKIASSVEVQPLTKSELLQNMARRAIGSKAFTAHFLPTHQVSTAELPWGERGTNSFSRQYLSLTHFPLD